MTMNNDDLSLLPNIGEVLKDRLIEIGIKTAADLRKAGSENAFLALREIDPGACINELMALEGAVQNIRWHHLDETKKQELREFLRLVSLNKK